MIENHSVQITGVETLVASDPHRAILRLRKTLAGDPLNADAYRLLGRALERPDLLRDERGVVWTSVRLDG